MRGCAHTKKCKRSSDQPFFSHCENLLLLIPDIVSIGDSYINYVLGEKNYLALHANVRNSTQLENHVVWCKNAFLNELGQVTRENIPPSLANIRTRTYVAETRYTLYDKAILPLMNIWIRSDEGLMLETSVSESLYGGQFT